MRVGWVQVYSSPRKRRSLTLEVGGVYARDLRAVNDVPG